MSRSPGNGCIDAERLWQDILALGEITDAGRPYTRRCFSDTFLAVALCFGVAVVAMIFSRPFGLSAPPPDAH